ncbi:MAG: TetR/AcrR family transcriptional regulator [Desulfatitalea sp.]|nr:TetR/AcrR family transcriptional regulator [Desulfatitalea sp.]
METKQRILAAASTVMTEKGLNESTIAEIAAKAQVAESVIYHYFKNKEDLLFSITAGHLQSVLDALYSQMEGIFEPQSQLSKMIWFHLNYNLTHKDYSYLLLYECRSNLNFYHHPAYTLIKQYAMVLSEIIDNGIKQGVFQNTLNRRIVRDIILGTLDWETIRLLMPIQEQEPVFDVKALMGIIIAMIGPIDQNEEIVEDKAKRILVAAEKVIAEKGYHKATISEIARQSMVAEGTVYEYFQNKEDLLLSIPQTRFLEQIEMLEEIFVIRDPVKKLRRFIRYHFFLYTNNPNFLRVFLLNICLNPRFHQSPSFATHEQYTSVVDHILDEGKAEGVFRADIDNKIFKSMFFGGFSHIAMRWEILKKNQPSIDKMHEVDELVDLYVKAVQSPPIAQ